MSRHGDIRYEVEWCSKLAFIEGSTDVDHDQCEMSVRYFRTLSAAISAAEKVYPETISTIGVVTLSKQRYTPYGPGDPVYIGTWDTVADPVHYSGEWGGDPTDLED